MINLKHIPIEDKLAAFDAMVLEFQGRGRYVGFERKTKDIKIGDYETCIKTQDYPIYEFVMRVKGHCDFAAALLALVKKRV